MKKNQFEFSTLNLVGTLFVADCIDLIAHRKYSDQSEADYKLLKGIKFSDQTSRAFNNAKAHYAEYALKAQSGSYDSVKQFILSLFRESLEYAGIAETAPTVINDVKYPVTIYVAENVPLVLAPSNVGLDDVDSRFTVEGVTSRKKSPFALAQMFLNASEPCTWAIVTNGKELRLLRDSESLVRPSYLSFDIESILKEDRYPDFMAFWNFMHASRVSVWEKWRAEGIVQGTRVREGLRTGVTNALLYLGAGFLKTKGKGNEILLKALAEGKRPSDGTPYTVQVFYKALLREIYRFLFLSTLEERGLIFAHADGNSADSKYAVAHKLYFEGYSIRRLAERAKKAIRTDRYTDLWHGVKVVYKAFQEGNDNLDLMPLGGLFKADQCPLLDACELDNEHLMKAIRQLRWNDIDGVKTFTDYRNMGTEEFGSVYESLLELVPHVDLQAKTFSFVGVGDEDGIVEEGSKKGNARKLSGSYYTDASLVQSLVKTALEPAIEAKLKAEEDQASKEKRAPDYERAILDFRLIDPGCGSGHFLLAGSRRLAEKLSEKRLEKTGESATAETYRKALRDVITNCVYGVDLNEMAVELARTALWLEGYEPGKPLAFLNHHIKCGNSLVGVFDVKNLSKGIPNSAFTTLIGDDKDVCNLVKKNNESQIGKKTQTSLFDKIRPITNEKLVELTRQIENLPNDNLEAEELKSTLYERLKSDADFLKNKTICDMYTAAFFAPKLHLNQVPTSQDVFDVMNGVDETKPGIRDFAQNLAEENKFFHWPIEFPKVFANGGFDCVLGNPPWDVSQLKEEEFFATILPEISVLPVDERGPAIEKLKISQPEIYASFVKQKRLMESLNSFYGGSGNYPLTTGGKFNLYAVFSELMLKLKRKDGCAGFVVPTGIATDDGTKFFFAHITSNRMLTSLYDFENKEGLFQIHKQYRFSLVTLAGCNGNPEFAFFLHRISDLDVLDRRITLSPESLKLVNPNTSTAPLYRSKKDVELTERIYNNCGSLINRSGNVEQNPWRIAFREGLFNISADKKKKMFKQSPGYGDDGKVLLPLYEGKMMYQMDHRFATFVPAKKFSEVLLQEKGSADYSVNPQYWSLYTETVLRATKMDSAVVKSYREYLKKTDNQFLEKLLTNCRKSKNEKLNRIAILQTDLKESILQVAEELCPKYLFAYRIITNTTNERTLIASVLPFCGVSHSMYVMYVGQTPVKQACFLANLNSICTDYAARQKVGGTNLTLGYFEQFPILPPDTFITTCINYIVPRVFALTYTATDIVEWARALWNDASVDLRKLMLAQHKDLPTGTDIETLAASDFDPASIPPIVFEDAHRAKLRAELDAYFAKLYGLSRRDLEYILDPKAVMGDDYPSETFRVLMEDEIKNCGEYRTQRLVLEAWDKMN